MRYQSFTPAARARTLRDSRCRLHLDENGHITITSFIVNDDVFGAVPAERQQKPEPDLHVPSFYPYGGYSPERSPGEASLHQQFLNGLLSDSEYMEALSRCPNCGNTLCARGNCHACGASCCRYNPETAEEWARSLTPPSVPWPEGA